MSVARILIVDDEPLLRQLLAEVLAERGLKTLQAADGPEALALLKSNNAVQFVLSDVKMPGMTGYEMVEQALVFRSELKVVMMTAYVTDLPTPQALRAREIRTLTKPFDPKRMVDLVFDMMSRP